VRRLLYVYLLMTILLRCVPNAHAQDVIYLKNGTAIDCRITEITDFILYAVLKSGNETVTFFSDDVSGVTIARRNEAMIWQLKQAVEDAREFTNLAQDSTKDYYFGFTYDSISNYSTSKKFYQTDSLGNPILVPYNPMKTPFSDRLKSLVKSFWGNPKDDKE